MFLWHLPKGFAQIVGLGTISSVHKVLELVLDQWGSLFSESPGF